MNHVAVDLGSRKSQYCVRSQDGQVLQEAKVETKALGVLFGQLEKSRVVLESCSEAFKIADLASSAGHEVTVVPATLAPSLGVGQRGVKTDRKDAQNLSMASCRLETLPTVHRPSALARDRRALITHRATLISGRTMFVNSVKGWARAQLLKIPSGPTSSFPKRAREAALAEPEGLPSYIERTLKMIDELNVQIAEANAELMELAEKDEICSRLMSTPGVGPVTAMSFRAAVDKIERFKSAHALEAYLGLTPGESSSGMKINRLGITHAGPAKVRTALVQAAWSAYRTRPNDPMVQWARKLAEKKPVQVAIVALARKMGGILFALWRDSATYNPAYQQPKH
jgi:transposase